QRDAEAHCQMTDEVHSRSSVRPGPEWQLQIEAPHEDPGGERRKKDSADQRFLRSKLMARDARCEDQADRRQDQAQVGHGEAEADEYEACEKVLRMANESHDDPPKKLATVRSTRCKCAR